MYHVIGTGITAVLLYFLSYLFYKNNLYSKQYHRRLWNLVLASAFILTASAGLFLALQINFKWNIPFIKSILKWHVEFGIAMAFTGIFHLLWHFSYYRDMLRKESVIQENNTDHLIDTTRIGGNLFLIGFISSSVQLLFLKEIMNISGGYELIAGIFLGSWLIGSAAGSGIANRSNQSDVRKINLIFSLSPLISLLMMVLLARLFLKTGETPSFLAGVIYTFLVLIPFCFVSGFTFVKLINIARAANKYMPGRSFSIETTGGIAAGIIIAVIGSGELNSYKSLLLITLLGISYVIQTYYVSGEVQKQVSRYSILVVAVLIIFFSPDLFFRQLLLRGVTVTESLDTPYGNITKADYGGEASTYYNQRLLAYSEDVAESEEDIHYAMLQAEKPENILLVSGPVNSHLREIVKYQVKKVVYVERDPALTRIQKAEDYEGFTEITIKNEDAYTYVRSSPEKFDVVIALLPPPSSLFLNRYYTIEFFNSAKKTMNQGGIFACSPGTNPNYLNKESVKLYSSVYNTLKRVFNNVVAVSGNKLYFIASDKILSTSFCQLVDEKKIGNFYVGPDYLSDDLIKAKSEEIISLMDRNIRVNSSSAPIACFYYQSFNLSKNASEKVPVIMILAALFLLPVTGVKRNNLVMYFIASSLAAFEIILLLMLQLTAGNMYQFTGLIIAGIMAGLAAGTGMNIRIPGKNPVIFLTLLLIVFYTLTGFVVQTLLTINGRFAIIILLIVAGFIPALFTGSVFRILTSTPSGYSPVSNVYNADLSGSAIGFIIFSGFIIPLAGLRSSIFILPLLVFTGLLFALLRNRH